DLEIIVRGVGEGTAAVDISHGPDAIHLGAQVIVDGDIAPVINLKTGGLEVEIGGVWRATNGQQKVTAFDRRTALAGFEGQQDATTRLGDRFDLCVEQERYALTFQDRADSVGNILVFP